MKQAMLFMLLACAVGCGGMNGPVTVTTIVGKEFRGMRITGGVTGYRRYVGPDGRRLHVEGAHYAIEEVQAERHTP